MLPAPLGPFRAHRGLGTCAPCAPCALGMLWFPCPAPGPADWDSQCWELLSGSWWGFPSLLGPSLQSLAQGPVPRSCRSPGCGLLLSLVLRWLCLVTSCGTPWILVLELSLCSRPWKPEGSLCVLSWRTPPWNDPSSQGELVWKILLFLFCLSQKHRGDSGLGAGEGLGQGCEPKMLLGSRNFTVFL